MGLLAEIQNDAVNDTTPVATLLRKVLVLASNLDSGVLEDWVKLEMNGYPPEVEVPEYRRIKMAFKASGANIAYKATAMPVPTRLVAAATGIEDIHIFQCRQPIGTIIAVDIDATKPMTVSMNNYSHLLPGKVVDESYDIHSFWGEFSASQVLGIIDAVRNRVLDFVLTLKKKYPNAGEVDGMTTKELAVGTVQHIFHTTINGNAGVVGNANHSTVNFTVNHGNLQDLRNQLTTHGVDAADVAELEAALAEEPKIGEDKKFGPKVSGWLGKMAGKAASGVWGVGLEVGSAVAQKALFGYYGLS
ncbi:hypothetical protein ASC97_12445 [Rhizobium sp. Root1203]|uniref:AbiTii domain-containing protein n=1 Tax=Rhizobium sp. Root1203 TaxID=1736427 RepID=UPI000710B1A7|nr:hypothetical protein [Rhizobium sp. Root1203]KQV14012.1 hypothetical protein ASC97_12445 [Rhizobium sp. Root1203]